jgi:hypothetical protein
VVSEETLTAAFHRIYIGDTAAGLRKEDSKKIKELHGLLKVMAKELPGPHHRPTLIDAAAGKAYVGLLAAELLFSAQGVPGSLLLLEKEKRRVALCGEAIRRTHAPDWQLQVKEAEVNDLSFWPFAPDLVVALHACGSAADDILNAAVARQAKRLLLVPCCTSNTLVGAPMAHAWMEATGMPQHAEVRRRLFQSIIDADRTLRLEAAGYETTVLAFVPPTVTPHHLVWRAIRVGEPRRMDAASVRLSRLWSIIASP